MTLAITGREAWREQQERQSARHRLTIIHDDEATQEPLTLCECGLHEVCNLNCSLPGEVRRMHENEPLKLMGRMELEPGEFIHNGRVWHCADRA